MARVRETLTVTHSQPTPPVPMHTVKLRVSGRHCSSTITVGSSLRFENGELRISTNLARQIADSLHGAASVVESRETGGGW